jgi:hypothetical protein
MTRTAGILLLIVGSLALWIYARGADVLIAILGSFDISTGLVIILSSWPRKIEHQSDVTASDIFRK